MTALGRNEEDTHATWDAFQDVMYVEDGDVAFRTSVFGNVLFFLNSYLYDEDGRWRFDFDRVSVKCKLKAGDLPSH